MNRKNLEVAARMILLAWSVLAAFYAGATHAQALGFIALLVALLAGFVRVNIDGKHMIGPESEQDGFTLRFHDKIPDEGVSPVIAVILMVAITVVLAATVWVWVSGFSHGASDAQPGSLSLQQGAYNASANAFGVTNATWGVRFTVVGASANFPLASLSVVDTTTSAGTITCTSSGGSTLSAGDVITCTGVAARATPGDVIVFSDTRANSSVLSITLHG